MSIVHSQAEKTSGFNSCFLGREWLNFSSQKLFCLELYNDVAKDQLSGWLVANTH